jgi:hypothetical protein
MRADVTEAILSEGSETYLLPYIFLQGM